MKESFGLQVIERHNFEYGLEENRKSAFVSAHRDYDNFDSGCRCTFGIFHGVYRNGIGCCYLIVCACFLYSGGLDAESSEADSVFSEL